MPVAIVDPQAIIKLAKNVHQANKEVGWWDDVYVNEAPVNLIVAGKIALIHSEISEAFLGWSTSAGSLHETPDDHLPEYPMFHVELADTAIRSLDLLGFYLLQNREHQTGPFPLNIAAHHFVSQIQSINHRLCTLHLITSDLLESIRKNQPNSIDLLHTLLRSLFSGFEDQLPDLMSIVVAKLAYNAERLDHKREHRAADGGKKF